MAVRPQSLADADWCDTNSHLNALPRHRYAYADRDPDHAALPYFDHHFGASLYSYDHADPDRDADALQRNPDKDSMAKVRAAHPEWGV